MMSLIYLPAWIINIRKDKVEEAVSCLSNVTKVCPQIDLSPFLGLFQPGH